MTPPTDTERAPWEIEIRDRGSEPPAEPPDRRRRGTGGRLAALVVLGVTCFVATVLLLGFLLADPDDEAVEDASPSTSSPITFLPRDDATTTTTAPTTTTASTTTTTAPTTTTTAPTTTQPATGTGSVPALSSSYGGGWVAMLTSVPYSAGTSRLEAAYAAVRPSAPSAVAARGDDWGSLGDGYWALVQTGFSSADDVRSFCAGVDRSKTDCAPRELRRG